MKKLTSAAFLALLAVTMLLPIASAVNAATVNHPPLMQGLPVPPPPPGGGGH